MQEDLPTPLESIKQIEDSNKKISESKKDKSTNLYIDEGLVEDTSSV
jgi:hypothetical protein